MKYSFIQYATVEYQDTTAPIYLLKFEMGFWFSVGLILALTFAAKILTILVLSCFKSKLQ